MMHDLTIETHHCCRSNLAGEASIGGYVQTKGPTPNGPCQYGWECSCKGFRFRGRCKHAAKAEESECGWNAFLHDGSPVEGKCPRCGGEITAMRWAV